MSDDPTKPSNSVSQPPNNEHFVERAANHPQDSTNPVKKGAGDMPKTVEESLDAQKEASSKEDTAMGKVQGVMGSVKNKLGSGGPDLPDN